MKKQISCKVTYKINYVNAVVNSSPFIVNHDNARKTYYPWQEIHILTVRYGRNITNNV